MLNYYLFCRIATVVVMLVLLLPSCGTTGPTAGGVAPAQPAVTAAPTATLRPTEVPPTPTSTTTPTSTPAPVTVTPSIDPNHPPFPTSLGPLALDMSADEVLRILGEPQQRTITHGVGSPQWHFANGLIIDLTGPEGIGDIRSIDARAPFDGKTPEGFGIGDSKERFKQLYAVFPIMDTSSPGQDQLQITDQHGLYMSATFDEAGNAKYINVLREG